LEFDRISVALDGGAVRIAAPIQVRAEIEAYDTEILLNVDALWRILIAEQSAKVN
jgi:hypothetical protein